MLCREFLLATCVALAPAALGSRALAQSTERVSVATGGEQANAGANSRTAVSSDGRFVVFVSTASNLVPNDTNGGADVFVRDLGVALALGDLNNDGVVNGTDLGLLLANWS